jgi:hypothetical protein
VRVNQLTCEDLLEIAKIAERCQTDVRIALGSWQVLVGVCKDSQRSIEKALWNIGYEGIGILNRIDNLPTYLLSGEAAKERLPEPLHWSVRRPARPFFARL